MYKYIITTVFLCFSITSNGQIQLPSLSPLQELSQKIGLTTVSLSYSRPGMRGRSLFGAEGVLVEGEKWRTGANAVTKFEVTSNIDLNKKLLEKGAYALLTSPRQDSCTFHFYTYESKPHTAFLKSDPVLEFTVPVILAPYAKESLTLAIEDVGLDGGRLVLHWSTYRVEVPMSVSDHEAVMSSIERTLMGPTSFAYFQAALYLHETQTDLPLALTYIRKANNDANAPFFQVYREALILKDLHKNTEAVEAAKRAMKLSEKAGNKDLARLSQRIINELE